MPDDPRAPEPPAATGGLVRIDAVAPESVDWLGRIPYGKLTVLDGDPGLGKSTLALDLAARLTAGRPMPDDDPPAHHSSLITHHSPSVLILSAEDAAADTIRPRLEAAGADLARVYLWSHLPDAAGSLPELPRDVAAIALMVERLRAALLIIDPLAAYLTRRLNPHSDPAVRRALAPIARLAQRRGLAVLVIRHLTKQGSRNPLYRGSGSIGLIGAARSGLLVAPDPDDPAGARRILASTKSNLGPPPPALAYRLVGAPNGAATIALDGPSRHTATTLVASAAPDSASTTLDEARSVLTAILADGPLPATLVRHQSAQAGVSPRTLDRAKVALGVRSRKLPDGWVWVLPPPSAPTDTQERQDP